MKNTLYAIAVLLLLSSWSKENNIATNQNDDSEILLQNEQYEENEQYVEYEEYIEEKAVEEEYIYQSNEDEYNENKDTYTNTTPIGKYRITTQALNIREKASKSANIVGRLYENQEVEIYGIEGNWAMVNIEGRKGYISTKYIELVNESAGYGVKEKGNGVLLIVGIFGLVCYIVALIKTKKGEMTTIVNWYDFTLLCCSFIIPAMGIFFGKDEDVIVKQLSISIGVLCFIGSAIWSVIENRDNYFHAFISVVAKMFIVMIMIIIILIILYNLFGRRTTKRVDGVDVKLSAYEQKIHDEKRQRNIGLATSAGSFLIISLIGSHIKKD